MSIGAAGQLDNKLIFRRAGRGHTVYPYFKPNQPKTAWQISRRVMFTFLMNDWANLTQPERDTWLELVPAAAPCPHQAYLGHNLSRWSTFRPPSRSYPATQLIDPGQALLTGGTGGTAHILWDIDPWMPKEERAYALFRATAPGIIPSPASLSLIFIDPNRRPFQYLDDNLAPATYFARLSTFSHDGLWNHYLFEKSATAT